MEIIDIDEEHVGTYCKCLEDWSHEFDDEAGHKRRWYEEQRSSGLRVKLARDEAGQILGMIQYAPAEGAPIIGKDAYYIYCIWVHGYKQGVGKHQHRGIGRLLLGAAEEDARRLGAKAMIAWGIRLPFFMRSSWFKSQGYRLVDSDGMAELVMKGFGGYPSLPRFIKPAKKVEGGTQKVKVSCFMNGWCPAQNTVYERAKRVAEEHPGEVEFVGINTSDRASLLEWGIVDGLFVDQKQVRTGPPPSYDKIKKIVEKRIRKRG